MKDYLYNFYNESNLKSERRKAMLDELRPYVVSKGIMNVSYKDIANYLSIERRTLYDYYKSKDEIIVDLAFICVNELNEQYMIIAEMLNIALTSSTAKVRLKNILSGIANIIDEKYTDLFNFLTEFDAFYHNLKKDSSAFLRYSFIITGFKTKNHYLKDIVKQLIEEENISDKYSADELIEILEQSFHAYLGRILIKKNESKRYNTDNIMIFIECIAEGVSVL